MVCDKSQRNNEKVNCYQCNALKKNNVGILGFRNTLSPCPYATNLRKSENRGSFKFHAIDSLICSLPVLSYVCGANQSNGRKIHLPLLHLTAAKRFV